MQIFLPQSQVEKHNNHVFTPIAKKYNIPYEKYEVNASRNTTIVSQNGSIIFIPADSLVDMNGILLSGKTDIYFREIRTAADIISNNIDMRVKDGGTNYNLKTSGMYELRGYQDKTPIKIRNGKNIKVEFVSNNKEVTDNYYYDESKQQWIKSNVQKQTQKSSLVPLVKPVKKTKTDYTIKANIDLSTFPNFDAYTGVEWKYTGVEDIRILEQRLTERLEKQEVEITDAQNLAIKYYLSSLVNSKNKIVLPLTPVFAEENYIHAVSKYEERIKLIAEMQAKRKKLLTEQNILNQFVINNFGYQNCDVVYRYPGHIFVSASFKIGQSSAASRNIKVYLITDNDSVVMKFENDFAMFNFNPNKSNKIVGIEEANKLGVLASSDFAKLKIQPNSPYSFELTEIQQDINTLENFNSLIKKL